ERGARIAAGGHRARIGECQASIAERRGEIESGSDRDPLCGCGRRHENEIVREELHGRGPEAPALREPVDPVEIGADEERGRSARVDLARERGARAVGDARLLAARGAIGARDLVQGFLEARRGEDEEARGERRGGKCGGERRDDRGDEPQDFASEMSFWSSPDWYISRMMSQPPTNSPFT